VDLVQEPRFITLLLINNLVNMSQYNCRLLRGSEVHANVSSKLCDGFAQEIWLKEPENEGTREPGSWQQSRFMQNA
jgi:hypothetical protein